MGYEARKTEHAGAKRGNGAYWGRKKDAKKESNKIRRRNAKMRKGKNKRAIIKSDIKRAQSRTEPQGSSAGI